MKLRLGLLLALLVQLLSLQVVAGEQAAFDEVQRLRFDTLASNSGVLPQARASLISVAAAPRLPEADRGSFPPSDLQILLSGEFSMPALNELTELQVEITNLSPGALAAYLGFELEFDPSEFEYVGGANCFNKGEALYCDESGSLNAAETHTYNIQLRSLIDHRGLALPEACVTGIVFPDSQGIPPQHQHCYVITGTQPIDPGILKTGPSQMDLGDEDVFEIVVENTSDEIIGGIEIVDTYTPGLTWMGVGRGGVGWSCQQSGTNEISCQYLPLLSPSTSTDPLTLQFQATAAGQQTNTAQITECQVFGKPCNENGFVYQSSNAVVNVAGQPPAAVDLAIGKTLLNASPVTVDDTVRFRVTVSSDVKSSDTTSLIRLTDNFPPGLTWDSVSGGDAGWMCEPAGTGQIVCDLLEPLPPGDTTSVELDFIAAAAGTHTNQVEITLCEVGIDDNCNNPSAIDTADVTVGAPVIDLGIEKTLMNTGPVILGDTVQFRVRVSNPPGGLPAPSATFIQFQDMVPSGLIWEDAFSPGNDWNCSGSITVFCDFNGQLAPGEFTDVFLNFNTTAPGTFDNTVQITQCQIDGDECNEPGYQYNSDTAQVEVETLAVNLDIDKILLNTDPISVDDSVDFRVTVTNETDSNAAATAIVFDDTFPDALLQFNGVISFDTWSCSLIGTGRLRCEYSGELVAGQSSSLDLTFTAIAAGSDENAVELGECQTDGNPCGGALGNDEAAFVVDGPAPFVNLTIVKELLSPDSVTEGDIAQFRVTVSNESASAEPSFIRFSDTFSSGLSWDGVFSGSGWDCTPAGVSSLDCDYSGALMPGAVVSVDLDFNTTQTGNATNTVEITQCLVGNDSCDNASASDTATVLVVSNNVDLRLTGLSDPAQVTVDQAYSYVFTVENLSGTTAGNVELLVELPQGVEYLGASGAGVSCTSNPPVVSCQVASSLPGGETRELALQVTAPSSPGELVASALVGSDETDANPADNTVEITTSVAGAGVVVDVSITMSSSAEQVEVGEPVTLSALLQNSGPDDATIGPVAVQFSSVLTFDQVAGSGWSCRATSSGASCTPDSSSLPVNASSLLEFVLVGNRPGDSPVNASASVFELDSNLDNNADEVTIRVFEAVPLQADLALTLEASSTTLASGETATLQALVSNAGPDDATEVLLEVTLGAELDFAAVSDEDWNCQQNGVLLRCDLNQPVLSAGQSSTLSFDVVASSGGSPTVGAVVSARETDPDPDNNTDHIQFQVSGAALLVDLAITAAGPGTPVRPGDMIEFELQVGNLGSDIARGVFVDANLGSAFEFFGATGSGWQCQASGARCVLDRDLAPGDTADLVLAVSLTDPAGGNLSQFETGFVGVDIDTSNNVAQVQSVIAMADVGIALSASATSLAVGSTSTLMALVTNAGPHDASMLRVNLNLGSGLSVEGTPSAGWSCATDDNSLVCQSDLAFLAPGQGSELRLDLLATESGSTGVSAQVSAREPDPDNGNNSDELGFEVLAPGTRIDLAILAEGAPAIVRPGESVEFALRVRNLGNLAAPEVTVEAELGSAFEFVSASGTGWTCSTAQASCQFDGEVEPSVDYQLVMSAQLANPQGTGLSVFTVSFPGIDADLANNVAEVQTTIAKADVSVSLSSSASALERGSTATLTALVANAGPEDASDVQLLVTPGDGLNFGTVLAGGWSCQPQGNDALCRLDAEWLAAGQSSELQFNVTAVAAGTASLRAEVSAREPDPVPANNVAELSFTVSEPIRIDLAISANGTPQSVSPGDSVSFDIRVDNLGNGGANGVFVDIRLGSAFAFVSGQGDAWTCTATRCQLSPELLPGESTDLSVSARVDNVSGSGLSEFEVGFSGEDVNPDNNVAQVSTEILQPVGADLRLTKTASADEVGGLESFSYVLEVENLGPLPAQGVVVVDPLPAELTLESASGAGWACSTGGGVVSCQLSGELAKGARSSVTLDVRSPAGPLTVVNRATVSSATEDPDSSNNVAEASVAVARVSDERVRELLERAAGDDPVARPLAGPLAGLCGRGAADVRELCDEIIDASDRGRDDDVRRALRAIAPMELTSQANSLQEMARAQFFNVDARLNELRGGGGGFSSSGLAMRFGKQLMPFSIFNVSARGSSDPDAGFGEGLVSPWGFFINGTLSTGDRRETRQEIGFDFETYGVTAGVDYRFSPSRVVGVALGYARFQTDYGNDSQLRTRGMTLTGYGSFYLSDNLYVDVRGSAGRSSFDQDRRIRFNIGDVAIDRLARGDSDATQLTLGTSIGYHYNVDRWNITPSLSARVSRNTIDGFTETGAGSLSMRFDSQRFQSTQLSSNLHVSRAVSTERGVFTPQFDIAWHRESRQAGLELVGRFADAPEIEAFRLRGEEFDQNYGSAGIGLVWVAPGGRQAYINYRNLFSADGMTRSTINLGARFEF